MEMKYGQSFWTLRKHLTKYGAKDWYLKFKKIGTGEALLIDVTYRMELMMMMIMMMRKMMMVLYYECERWHDMMTEWDSHKCCC